MDRVIASFSHDDGDLVMCHEHGVAYQRDMSIKVPYDGGYWNKCASYEDQEIALKINAGRIALVERHLRDWPFHHGYEVLDVGIGCGEFIKKRPNTYGYDVNPVAVEWLKDEGLWSDDFTRFRVYTFWDVIEHVEDPGEYFRHMVHGSLLFTSIPIFQDLNSIRASKHYRPGEHLYYWTEEGFIAWMKAYGFHLLERATFEMEAGRESIYSFAFRRAIYRKP